jgi:predicted  nucleic acid-binding Zn-ribbon protein
MRIKSIDIHNFLSFKSAKLELAKSYDDPPTLYIIDGINYDTESEDASNGSGKSTLIGESIMYNLFGRGLRGSKQKVKLNDMIRNGTSKMANSVEYFINSNDDAGELKISRTKVSDGASTTEVEIDGKSKTKRTKRLSDKDIKMFVDFSADTFSQVIVYYRDNINLLSMNYGQRLDFFKNMVDLSIIDEYYIKAKDFINTNDRLLDRLYLNRKNTNEIINIVTENKDKYIEYLNIKLEELKSNLTATEAIKTEDPAEYKTQISNINKELTEIDLKISECQNTISINRNNIDKLQKEIKKFSSLSGIPCPTCKQMVTNEYITSISENYNSEIAEFKGLMSEAQTNLESFSVKRKSLKNEIDKINVKINEINSEIILKNESIKNLKLEIKKIQLDIDKADVKTENVDKSKYEKRLDGIEKAIHIRETWKDSAEYWNNLFAPKSLLRSAIIRKYVTILSDIFEYYISKLYNNEILGKITIDDDGQIDIILYKDGYETNYWQMSSGERKRIDIAMILSLYEFTSYINPNMPKFLILDEIYDALDYPGIVVVTETLLDMQKRHGIDLFIITHIPLPMENIPETVLVKNILVTKKDKCSTVKYLG